MADLWGVLVGGVIAAASGVGTQWFTHFIKMREDRRGEKGAKLEQLIELMYEYEGWLDRKRNHLLFDEEKYGSDPIAKIEAVCAVHFPRFLSEVGEMRLAARGYELWMIGAKRKRLTKDPKFDDGFEDAYRPSGRAWNKMMDQLREYARKEFGTKDLQKTMQMKPIQTK